MNKKYRKSAAIRRALSVCAGGGAAGLADVSQKAFSGGGCYGNGVIVYRGECVRDFYDHYVPVTLYDLWFFTVLYRTVSACQGSV